MTRNKCELVKKIRFIVLILVYIMIKANKTNQKNNDEIKQYIYLNKYTEGEIDCVNFCAYAFKY